jgi:indole-3-glycerol phosphate synthase/phosphoribosylanthranilate isomerase
MSFLQMILPSKQAEVATLRAALAQATPTRADNGPVRDFAAALQGGNRLIAEIKRKSPSHPSFRQLATPANLARTYRRNGAAALSIVTDAAHFGTSLEDVAVVRAAAALPVLVKDFVIDEVQVLAAWAAGADAVLLIVRMLDRLRLGELLAYAESLGLHVLVECHDRTDIDLALAARARLIGVNNRNLATLTTDLAHGAAMLPHLARPAVRVSESGLYVRADIEHMAALGADAFLVGHALLGSRDPGRKVAELLGREREGELRVKTCGITTPADALLAHHAGAHVLGLIFAPSARQVDVTQARQIRQAVPEARLCGVFVDAPPAAVAAAAEACDLDLIQLHGSETPEACREVAELCGRPLIKALAVDQATPALAATYHAASYFLVDLPKGIGRSGTTPADCRAAALALIEAGHDVFLAGGLTPDAVHAAVAAVRPFGVDVASGIETSPGLKDPTLVRTFITEATR